MRLQTVCKLITQIMSSTDPYFVTVLSIKRIWNRPVFYQQVLVNSTWNFFSWFIMTANQLVKKGHLSFSWNTDRRIWHRSVGARPSRLRLDWISYNVILPSPPPFQMKLLHYPNDDGFFLYFLTGKFDFIKLSFHSEDGASDMKRRK